MMFGRQPASFLARAKLAGAARCGRERFTTDDYTALVTRSWPATAAGSVEMEGRPSMAHLSLPGQATRYRQRRLRTDDNPNALALQGRCLPGQRLPHPDHRLDG